MNKPTNTKLKELSDEELQARVDELKAELKRRQTLERARRHLPTAEAALQRAKEKVERYRKVLRDDPRT